MMTIDEFRRTARFEPNHHDGEKAVPAIVYECEGFIELRQRGQSGPFHLQIGSEEWSGHDLYDMEVRLYEWFQHSLPDAQDDRLAAIKNLAQARSMDGCTYHVNRVKPLDPTDFTVSDWYCEGATVCSFSNGREIQR